MHNNFPREIHNLLIHKESCAIANKMKSLPPFLQVNQPTVEKYLHYALLALYNHLYCSLFEKLFPNYSYAGYVGAALCTALIQGYYKCPAQKKLEGTPLAYTAGFFNGLVETGIKKSTIHGLTSSLGLSNTNAQAASILVCAIINPIVMCTIEQEVVNWRNKLELYFSKNKFSVVEEPRVMFDHFK